MGNAFLLWKSVPCHPSSSFSDLYGLPPSPFLQHPELFRVVQNPLQRNGSGHFYCLELSCFVRDCASAVLGKVLGIDEQVLGINIRVR